MKGYFLTLLIAFSMVTVAHSARAGGPDGAPPVPGSAVAKATAELKGAIQNGDMKAFRAALASGADVNAWDANAPDDAVPLAAASAAGKLPMVNALLAHGADVNAHTVTDPNYEFVLPPGQRYFDAGHYESPVTAAASQHDAAVLTRLLKAGANIRLRDLSGENAFHAALMGNNNDIKFFRYLIARGYDPGGERWNDSLVDASFSGNVDLIDLLLTHGSKVNGAGRNGTTALMSAACGHNGPVAALLISKGAEVNARDKTSTTALGFAQRGGPPVPNGPNDKMYPAAKAKYDQLMAVLTANHATT
jgi:uncharacterized protein